MARRPRATAPRHLLLRRDPRDDRWLAGAADTPGLPPRRWHGLQPPYERVVLVLADALGWHRLAAFADEPFARRLLDDGHVVRLTTQFPSTTTAHVTTLCTGKPGGRDRVLRVVPVPRGGGPGSSNRLVVCSSLMVSR